MPHQPLEELKQLLADKKLHWQIGIISQIEISGNRQTCRVMLKLQPDDHQIVAKVTWPIIDDEAGVLMLPRIGDLGLVGLVNGDEEQAYLVDRCSSHEERIAVEALDGSLVIKAAAGHKTKVLSDTKILLQKGVFGAESDRADATSPVVLGDVLKTFEDAVWNGMLNAPQIGWCAVGPVFLDGALRTIIQQAVQQYVDTAATNFLSQLSFTERGGA